MMKNVGVAAAWPDSTPGPNARQRGASVTANSWNSSYVMVGRPALNARRTIASPGPSDSKLGASISISVGDTTLPVPSTTRLPMVNLTVAGTRGSNPRPVMVRRVPPVTGPLCGCRPVMAYGGPTMAATSSTCTSPYHWLAHPPCTMMRLLGSSKLMAASERRGGASSTSSGDHRMRPVSSTIASLVNSPWERKLSSLPAQPPNTKTCHEGTATTDMALCIHRGGLILPPSTSDHVSVAVSKVWRSLNRVPRLQPPDTSMSCFTGTAMWPDRRSGGLPCTSANRVHVMVSTLKLCRSLKSARRKPEPP